MTYVGFEDIGGVLDVGDVVAELLDGVDQTPDVSCTIVEQVCSRHFFSFRLLFVGWLVGWVGMRSRGMYARKGGAC